MINNILAPGLVSLWVSISNTTYADTDRIPKISGWLCIFQTFLFIFASFVTRVSEARRNWYVAVMPELAYVASVFAMAIVPLIVIIINFTGFYVWDGFEHLASLMVLNVCAQFCILIQYFFMSFLKTFHVDFLI